MAKLRTSAKHLSMKLSSGFESPVTVELAAYSTNDYSTKILAGLRKLQEQDILCDLELAAEDIKIKVHRVVMAACSDYFCAMLTTDMLESRQNKVELLGVSSEGLKAMVHFAYRGVLHVTLENAVDVLAAASHLQMTEAIDLCCKCLESVIALGNCVDIYNLAEFFNLPAMAKKAHAFILNNFEPLSSTPQFEKLSFPQLKLILMDNGLKVSSEYCVFELLLNWIKLGPNREKHFVELLECVRLPMLSGEELVEKVSKVDLIKKSPSCLELLTLAKDYHIVTAKQPLLQSRHTQVRSNTPSLVLCHTVCVDAFNLVTKKHATVRDSIVPLYNPCVCVIGNFLYACGGKYDGSDRNDIATARCFRYDPRFDSWFEVASMTEARNDFAMVSVGNHLYAVAGQDENVMTNSVECYSVEENYWDTKAPIPQGTNGHSSSVCRGLIYVSGGHGYINKLVSYDIVKDSWAEKNPMNIPRIGHMMETINEKLYVIGGTLRASNIECYNPDTDQWTLCDTSVSVRRAGSCVFENKILIVGGMWPTHDVDCFMEMVHVYDPDAGHLQKFDWEESTFEDKFPVPPTLCKGCCILTLPTNIF